MMQEQPTLSYEEFAAFLEMLRVTEADSIHGVDFSKLTDAQAQTVLNVLCNNEKKKKRMKNP